MAVAGEQTPSRHLEEWMDRFFLQLLHTVRANHSELAALNSPFTQRHVDDSLRVPMCRS